MDKPVLDCYALCHFYELPTVAMCVVPPFATVAELAAFCLSIVQSNT